MKVRREDEQLINSLKMFGGAVGLVLSVLAVLQVSGNARNRLAEQREMLHQYAPLLAANGMAVMKEEGKRNDGTVSEFVRNFNEVRAEFDSMGGEFWVKLSFTGLLGICVGAGVGGLLGGYFSMWALSSVGTVAMIRFIRGLYGVMWRINPHFDGGMPDAAAKSDGWINRDTDRVLPGIVKLLTMAVIGLVVLAVVIFWITR